MKSKNIANWLWAGVAALSVLTGCGGGGTSADQAAAAAAPPADARNGDYTAFAANAYPYTLSLNFDAKTYSVSGDTFKTTGTFVAEGSKYVFLPAPAGAVQNTAKFSVANDTVIGGFNFGTGVIPFVAPRRYVTTVADAAGTYNFLSTAVDTAAPSNNAIFSGEITAAGQLRTCTDFTIYTIAQCPAASVVAGTLTVSGPDFVSNTPSGPIRFRVALIGSDKVVLRASASTATARQFWVGTPAVAYAPGTFTMVNTLGQAGTSSVSLTAYSSTLVTSAGATVSSSGSVTASALPTGMLHLSTTDTGELFSVRAADIAVIVASRGSVQAPGLVQIGRP